MDTEQLTAEQLLLDRRLNGRVQFYRDQQPDGLHLVFYKSRGGGAERQHEQRFRLEGNTLTPINADG